jgi:hypothetical protein
MPKCLSTMATHKQKAANAANAKKSTGPQTATGKANSSKNATSHGLTTPPAETEVLRWLRIISEDPKATPDSPGEDALGRAVWALAIARARLDRANATERHYAAELARFAKTHGEPDPFRLDPDDLDDPAVLRILLRGEWDKAEKQGLRIMLAINSNSLAKLVKRLKRIERYVRQAEREKKKAFAAWQHALKAAV